jgi:hypothetical protein
MESKNKWSPYLGASIALEINKNGLEVRKLCIDEVGRVKMKKIKENVFCNLKKRFFQIFFPLLWL